MTDEPQVSTARFSTACHIAVVGGGIAGLTAGLAARRAGAALTLYEAEASAQGASDVAGAMLAPYAEIEALHPDDIPDARAGLAAWDDLAAGLDDPGCLARTGALLVAHPRDRAELDRMHRRLTRAGCAGEAAWLNGDALGALEPGLAGRFSDALHLPAEGHADARRLLAALRRALEAAGGTVRPVRAEPMRDGRVMAEDGETRFDAVLDCRGMGARTDLPALRGVRGETLVLRSREVALTRTVRLMHPRWPLYVVPQGDGRFVVGASEVETDDAGPMRARSALELLSAAYAVDPAFGEAEIEALRVGVRPAFPDNRPRLVEDGRVLRLNGFYRHGFLLAPIMARRAVARLAGLLDDGRGGAGPGRAAPVEGMQQ